MEEISKNIGTVHDIDQFSFIAELEDYFFKHQNQEVQIELMQGKNTTEGLLNIRVINNTDIKVLYHDDLIKLIETVFSIKADEVYVNFAGHIVYLIILK